jgi:DNA-binding transcriptional LysR family regulator
MRNINIVDISRLDLNLAITFLAIWQEGSVSKAARKLSLSQSAVSAALARLRVAADDPLFLRTRSGMVPTPRAMAMAEQIGEGVEQLRRALMLERGFDPATSTRHFSLGMSDDFEVAIGPAIAAALLDSAPHVSVVFRQANRHTVVEMLEAREIDLAVAVGVPAKPGLVAEPLGRSGYLTMLNNDLCRVPLPLSLEDFLSLPQILISYSGREGVVDEALKAIGRSRRIHTALTHFSSVPTYLASMRAVASLPAHAALVLARGSGLSISPPPLDLGAYSVAAICRRDVADDAAIRWLLTIVRDAFSASIAPPD